MKVLSIACNNCGGPLEVPNKVRFLTCNFCDSRLEVQQSGSTYYTNVLEAVGDLKHEIESLKLEGKLQRLDRDWQEQREGLKVRDKHGRSYIPSKAGTVVMMVVMIFGALVVFGMWSSMSSGMPAGLILILVVIVLVIGSIHLGKAKEYEEKRARYTRKRRELMRELSGR